MNFLYIILFNYTVISFNNSNFGSYNIYTRDPEKAAWENNVKKIKAEQAYAERIASVASKKVPEYLQNATKNRDEAKHVYDCAKNLPRPQLIHTGYDIQSFKRAVKQYDGEMAAYNTMLETLKKEVTDAENRLLEDQGKYYSI
jgi:uncharacterized protein YukE